MSEMTYNVLIGTLNVTHSLSHSPKPFVSSAQFLPSSFLHDDEPRRYLIACVEISRRNILPVTYRLPTPISIIVSY